MLFLTRQPLDDVYDLRTALGNAIALELGTIPPYLTALFSIKPGSNPEAGAIVRSVVIEEMLHLSLACNMLNAVHGCPDLPGALLRYPSPLPMGIGDEPGKEFCVPLARLSEDSIATFMTIEEPEHEIHFERHGLMAAAAGVEYHTIGEFYAAVGELMTELGEDVFTGVRERQVSGWIGTDYLHPVYCLSDALKAIELIVEQGEGTGSSPVGGPGEMAHFYRFEQIKEHATLNPDPSEPGGFSWGAPVIPLDDAGVWPMIDNPPQVPLPEGSPVARVSDQFDATFTVLMNDLQRTFDGSPQLLGSALAQMHALRLEAQQLMPMAVPGKDGTAGPRFLYVD